MAAVMVGHIEMMPDVCGGKPRISGHRLTVQDIAIWHQRMSLDPDEIAAEHGLELGEVYAALAYYHDHRADIDVWRIARVQLSDCHVWRLGRLKPTLQAPDVERTLHPGLEQPAEG